MPDAIDAMRSAFGQLSSGNANMPLRSRVESDKGVTLVMPVYLKQSRDCEVKVVSIYGGNPSIGLPAVPGVSIVIDPDNGMARALMDAHSLTCIRTGAGGGLAAQLLSRPDSKTVALFGVGDQARTQLQAVMAVRSIEQVYVTSRSNETAQRFCDEVSSWPNAPQAMPADRRKAVSGSDIIVCATPSTKPVFDGADIRPGTHITGVGSYTPDMQEVDTTAVERATVFVDSREAAAQEAGDLIIAGATIAAELGEVVNGEHPGRTSDDEVTFFKSVGVAAQDAVAARMVLDHAEQHDLGVIVEI